MSSRSIILCIVLWTVNLIIVVAGRANAKNTGKRKSIKDSIGRNKTEFCRPVNRDGYIWTKYKKGVRVE